MRREPRFVCPLMSWSASPYVATFAFTVNWTGRVCVESPLPRVSWKKLWPLKIYTCELFLNHPSTCLPCMEGFH